jgi:hypothetical protein
MQNKIVIIGAGLDFKPDMTILTVKTQDVEAAAFEIKPYGTNSRFRRFLTF